MKTVAIAQARMGSTRVPGKVMRDLEGWPVIEWVYRALKMAPGIDEIVIATSTLPDDDIIAEHCKAMGAHCFRGSETNVLERFYQCAVEHKADIVLRITCDCPFLDPVVVGEVVRLRQMAQADYASNVDPPTYPDGLDVEVFTMEALTEAHEKATRPTDRDTVTQYISRNRSRFKVVNATCPVPGLGNERWVLDTEDDWSFCQKLASKMIWETEQSGVQYNCSTYLKILTILDQHPEIRAANQHGVRNERFYAALAEEDLHHTDFSTSKRLLARSLRSIPIGSQTFSKSHIQFPAGNHPLYVTHADGARIFDVDGNDYVDLVGAVLPVILGYRDPDVDEAIRRQLDRGISFSLATELEAELAEMLIRIIPCAEMVRFGKTGTDVTSAAVRLARAYTGRDYILMSGYHGWADWSMAPTDRSRGIPQAVADLTCRIPFGDIKAASEAMHRYTGQVAAIIVEPNSDPKYLEFLRNVCDANHALLIFDEIITGFRYSMGGAQELFNVTPDLACFGKAMANGMPLSAIAGRRDIMSLMQPPDNIFYSGTFFGETLSLAASIATIKKLERCDVPWTLNGVGACLSGMARDVVSKWGLEEHITFPESHYSRQTIAFSDDKIRTAFLMGMAEHGVLIINSHNVSYAHRVGHTERIKKAYDNTCGLIRCALDNDGLDDLLVGVPIVGAAPLRAA